MLYLLIAIILFTTQQNLYAQNTFFKSKADFFKEQNDPNLAGDPQKIKGPALISGECATCSTPPEEQTKDLLFDNDRTDTIIKLFIDPDCRYSKDAVNIFRKVIKDNHNLKGQIYLISSFSGLISFSQKNLDLVNMEIPIALDTEEIHEKQYDIKSTPSFIVETKGKVFRILGEPGNLMELIKGVL